MLMKVRAWVTTAHTSSTNTACCPRVPSLASYNMFNFKGYLKRILLEAADTNLPPWLTSPHFSL